MWHLHWLHQETGRVASSMMAPGAAVPIPAGATHVVVSEHEAPAAALGNDLGRPRPLAIELDAADAQLAADRAADEKLLAKFPTEGSDKTETEGSDETETEGSAETESKGAIDTSDGKFVPEATGTEAFVPAGNPAQS